MINIGDKVRITYRHSDVVITGTVQGVDGVAISLGNRNYFTDDSRHHILVTERAPIPEPQFEGAIVSGESALTGPHRFVRIDNGCDSHWLSIDGFRTSMVQRGCDNWEFVSRLKNFKIEYDGKS